VYLSDIWNAAGMAVDTQFWEGQMQSQTPNNWPRMEMPTKTKWQVWKRMVTLALQLGWNRQLAIPLGK